MVIHEKIILRPDDIRALLEKLLKEILKSRATANLALVGVKTGGEYIANWLEKETTSRTGKKVLKGLIDITLYRDDLFTKKKQPTVRSTDIRFDVNRRNIILVDDVLFTGRTTRAALDALSDLGRPKKVQLAVLIDRGHRELPIQPDFVGKIVETKRDEMVEVDFGGPKQDWSVKLKYGIK